MHIVLMYYKRNVFITKSAQSTLGVSEAAVKYDL